MAEQSGVLDLNEFSRLEEAVWEAKRKLFHSLSGLRRMESMLNETPSRKGVH